MESNLFIQAQQYQREHNWHKAIACYEQLLNENKALCEDSVFVSYAKSLRINSQTKMAKDILIKGIKQHPRSEKILLEFLNLYDFLGDWVAANNVSKTLVKLRPTHAEYHFKLGRTYSFLLNPNKAKTAFQNGLQYTHQLPFEKIIEKIQRGFAEVPSDVKSTYIFVDGKNNLGGFIHRYRGKNFFTKIAKYINKNTAAAREESFYKDLCTEFSHLKNFTPTYIDSQTIDGISYLTIEMIDTIQHPSGQYHDIINTAQEISSIRYEQITQNYSMPKYVYQFKRGRAISVVHFFTQIHEKKYNEKLFQSLKLIIKQQSYPKAAAQVVQRLESAIMDNQLYRFILPKEHYSLLHGDFAYQNVIISSYDRLPRVIDWSTFTIGPHFIDIARYFTSLLVPYSTIKTIYLENINTGGKLSLIEQIFFLYALTLFYFQKLGRIGIETNLSGDLLPALEDLEKLVNKFNTEMEVEVVAGHQTINDDLREKDLQITQLQQRLSIVEAERKHLHKRLQNILSSKSWKITTPLRIFMEGKKKKT